MQSAKVHNMFKSNIGEIEGSFSIISAQKSLTYLNSKFKQLNNTKMVVGKSFAENPPKKRSLIGSCCESVISL